MKSLTKDVSPLSGELPGMQACMLVLGSARCPALHDKGFVGTITSSMAGCAVYSELGNITTAVQTHAELFEDTVEKFGPFCQQSRVLLPPAPTCSSPSSMPASWHDTRLLTCEAAAFPRSAGYSCSKTVCYCSAPARGQVMHSPYGKADRSRSLSASRVVKRRALTCSLLVGMHAHL